mgnify:FL=1|jgi:hypothetical protein
MNNMLIAVITSSAVTILWLKWFWSAAQKKIGKQNEELTRMLTEFVERYIEKVIKDRHNEGDMQ